MCAVAMFSIRASFGSNHFDVSRRADFVATVDHPRFQLKGPMGNSMSFLDESSCLRDHVLHGLRGGISNFQVRFNRDLLFVDVPEVDMVNVDDAIDFGEGVADIFQVYVGWRAQHEDVGGLVPEGGRGAGLDSISPG